MKKLTVILLLMLATATAFAQKDVATWSLGIKGGLDYYRVEPYAQATDDYWAPFMKSQVLQAGWAAPVIFVERNITPYYGLGVELGYFTYNRSNQMGSYAGGTLDAVLYGSVNISNLVVPNRHGNWKKFAMYGNLGVGAGWYHHDNPNNESKKSFSPLGLLSMTAAYGITNKSELFLEGQYRVYTKEDLGGISERSEHSVDAATLLIGYRFKIGAGSKPHTRNMSPDEFNQKAAAPQPVVEKDEKTPAQVKALENEVKSLQYQIDDLKKEVNNLNKARDNAQNDAIKDLKDKVNALQDLKKGEGAAASVSNIEFEFNSSNLTPNSKVILDEYVRLLNSSKWNKLAITGHTDNVGNAAYNKKLSKARANAVKVYLTGAGIDGSKISTQGFGSERPVISNDTAEGRQKNRRVDFELSK
jgi:outer membrane protein OmpA-like peptidoglycan-associated protein